jgi:hypothetical protein
MTVSIMRKDYTSSELRSLSCKARTVSAARRMLAIASILEENHARMRQKPPVWIARHCETGFIVIMTKV